MARTLHERLRHLLIAKRASDIKRKSVLFVENHTEVRKDEQILLLKPTVFTVIGDFFLIVVILKALLWSTIEQVVERHYRTHVSASVRLGISQIFMRQRVTYFSIDIPMMHAGVHLCTGTVGAQ
jgi:hypothetical protein